MSYTLVKRALFGFGIIPTVPDSIKIAECSVKDTDYDQSTGECFCPEGQRMNMDTHLCEWPQGCTVVTFCRPDANNPKGSISAIPCATYNGGLYSNVIQNSPACDVVIHPDCATGDGMCYAPPVDVSASAGGRVSFAYSFEKLTAAKKSLQFTDDFGITWWKPVVSDYIRSRIATLPCSSNPGWGANNEMLRQWVFDNSKNPASNGMNCAAEVAAAESAGWVLTTGIDIGPVSDTGEFELMAVRSDAGAAKYDRLLPPNASGSTGTCGRSRVRSNGEEVVEQCIDVPDVGLVPVPVATTPKSQIDVGKTVLVVAGVGIVGLVAYSLIKNRG